MKVIRIISRIVAIGLVIVLLVTGFLWLTYREVNTNTKQVFDIFGRELTQPPIWARIFLTDEALWAGAGWLIIDAVLFWAVIFVIYRLFIFGYENE